MASREMHEIYKAIDSAYDAGMRDAPGAIPSSESQGHCERSRLATGSLPVSSAHGFIHAMEDLAALERIGIEIQAISRRLSNQVKAEMESAMKRQPEENIKVSHGGA